jgi:hypothetical protein
MREQRAGHRLRAFVRRCFAAAWMGELRSPAARRAFSLALSLLLGSISWPAMAADPTPDSRPGLLVCLRDTPARGGNLGSADARAVLSPLISDLGATWERAFPAHPSDAARSTSGADPLRAEELRTKLATVAVARFPDPAALAAALARLRSLPEVDFVEPITPITLAGEGRPGGKVQGAVPAPGSASAARSFPPLDEQYPNQWALPLIGMPAVWAVNPETPGLLIAIIDTGIETTHPDLAPNLSRNALEDAGQPGVDDDQNGYVDDILGWNALAQNGDIEDGFGHGSHVAGIIGAAANGRGTVGVTWAADLMPVRMFDNFGRGTNLAGAQGITYAADRGAQVVNMSWGTGRNSRAIQLAIEYAAATGAVLVASAGNDGEQVLDNFPAAYDAVIAIGATNPTDGRAQFSNHGVRVDLVAPGVDILSTEHGAYFTLSGTSQSAGYVSGVAAHLRYRYPALHAEEVRSILRQSAVDLGRRGWDPFFGAGRLDAASALADPQAPSARILAPHTLAATAAASIEVMGAVEPPAGASSPVEYQLEVGQGEDPASFELWTTGRAQGLVQFPPVELAGRPEGDLTLRLRVQDGYGRSAENRVLIKVDRRPPVLVQRETVNRLSGSRLEQMLRYGADEPVIGRVYVRAAGSGGVPDTLASLEAATDHAADLSGFLPGRYDYWIEIQDLAGFQSLAQGPQGTPFEREVLPVIDVPADGMQLRERFTRFELGAVADLDGDGRAEVLGERSGESGPGEGGLSILGVTPDGRLVERARGGAGLPIAARDVDGDGLAEVLVANSGLALYASLTGPAPRLLWQSSLGDRRAGGQLTDVDGDGRVEVLFSTTSDGLLTMVEWNGGGFDPVPIEMVRSSRSAGFAVGDFDQDGRSEVVFGTLSGEIVALEPTADNRIVETWREIFAGGIANAITACAIGDADGDGRPELAISAVGALLDRAERPTAAILESPADDRYEVTASFEFRDKNTPYDNALAAGDIDHDGRPEILVAQAGDIYLVAADRDRRYLPIWHASRGPGGRAAIGDLDGDGASEIIFTERSNGVPVTAVYSLAPAVKPEPPLAWQPVLHPLGTEIAWQSPAPGFRIFDLAVYRAPARPIGRPTPPVLESDLQDHRLFEQPGEVTSGDRFQDAGAGPGENQYFLGYTVNDGSSRRRILEGPRSATAAPGVPQLLVLAPNPNPTAGSMATQIALARSGRVSVKIVDPAGRIRRQLLAGDLAAGPHALRWDGRDEDGHRLARGVYFLVASGLGEEQVVRITLIGGGAP